MNYAKQAYKLLRQYAKTTGKELSSSVVRAMFPTSKYVGNDEVKQLEQAMISYGPDFVEKSLYEVAIKLVLEERHTEAWENIY